jgi:hypothetical protein
MREKLGRKWRRKALESLKTGPSLAPPRLAQSRGGFGASVGPIDPRA